MVRNLLMKVIVRVTPPVYQLEYELQSDGSYSKVYKVLSSIAESEFLDDLHSMTHQKIRADRKVGAKAINGEI